MVPVSPGPDTHDRLTRYPILDLGHAKSLWIRRNRINIANTDEVWHKVTGEHRNYIDDILPN